MPKSAKKSRLEPEIEEELDLPIVEHPLDRDAGASRELFTGKPGNLFFVSYSVDDVASHMSEPEHQKTTKDIQVDTLPKHRMREHLTFDGRNYQKIKNQPYWHGDNGKLMT